MKTVTLKIQRFDPENDQRPYWAEYQVAVEAKDRLLDALHKIKWEQDGSLTFRRSCGHGVCGSDTMSVNGLNRLACQLLMERLPDKITIMPLLAFRVIKDLVVDLEPFFAQYEKIKLYLINDESSPLTERLQTPEQHARYEEGTKCILCACCTSSCPVTWGDPAWVGPAAIVNAHRFLFDSRDRGAALRLAFSVWYQSCEFLFYAHKAAAPILLVLLLLLNDACIISIVAHRSVAGCLAKVNKL